MNYRNKYRNDQSGTSRPRLQSLLRGAVYVSRGEVYTVPWHLLQKLGLVPDELIRFSYTTGNTVTEVREYAYCGDEAYKRLGREPPHIPLDNTPKMLPNDRKTRKPKDWLSRLFQRSPKPNVI